MRKIPTLFVRDFSRDNGRYVTEEVTPGCEWVLAGEGVPTRKYDGTCVMFDGTDWWARREIKADSTVVPDGYQVVEVDGITGKTIGWEPIAQSPFAKFHAEVMDLWAGAVTFPTGTYELIGPKVNGNPERRDRHELIGHATATQLPNDRHLADFRAIRATVARLKASDGCEGIVWHHPDGRMAKIKARDFRPAGEVHP